MARQKAPEGETPAQRFIRVATLRTSNVIQAIEILGTQGADVPDDAFTDKAFGAIQDAVDKARALWANKAHAAKRRVFDFGGAVPQQSMPQTAAAPAKPATAKR